MKGSFSAAWLVQTESSLLTTYWSEPTSSFSRYGEPASRHGSLNSLFQVVLYLPDSAGARTARTTSARTAPSTRPLAPSARRCVSGLGYPLAGLIVRRSLKVEPFYVFGLHLLLICVVSIYDVFICTCQRMAFRCRVNMALIRQCAQIRALAVRSQ
jgi:hypothetical protein